MDVTQVRGMLFEEAVLYLLGTAGYRTIDEVDGDPTLQNRGAGLAVLGRGGVHQIDAIADYLIGQPFSHRQRLLVEAKCFTNNKPVDLQVTRNAVGVLKDVSEFWSTARGLPADHRRYHYQQAIFSATSFTQPAECFAFAHDIKLFPMGDSECFAGIRNAIFSIDRNALRRAALHTRQITFGELRRKVRTSLREEPALSVTPRLSDLGPEWSQFIHEVALLGGVVVALVSRSFPLFLVPASRFILAELGTTLDVRVRRGRGSSWSLQNSRNETLFTFEIPPVLFAMYADAGILTSSAAAQMKIDLFSDLQAVLYDGDMPRLVRFQLDSGWLDRLVTYARRATPAHE